MGGSKVKKRGFLRKLGFSILPLLILIGFFELGMRIFPPSGKGETQSGFVEPDPDLIWRLKPADKVAHSTNDLGFRDRPFNPQADRKILLLGDSVSWGDGIEATEDIFPCLMETRLKELRPKHTFEVINTAVPGYSTFQQLRFMQLRGLDLQPDLILLQFCLNDVTERYSRLAQYGGDTVFLGIDTRKAVPGLSGWLIRHSKIFEALMRILVRAARREEEYRVQRLSEEPLGSSLTDAWSLVLKEIDGIRSLAGERQVPFLIVIAPYRFQLENPGRFRQPQNHLLYYCREHEVPVLDLLPPFYSFWKRTGADPFRDANHFSLVGHDVAAQEIAEAVLPLLKGE